MPAGIETDGDRATFVAVKEHGWHQMGTLVEHDITVPEGLSLAHLADREYHLEPVAVPVGSPPRFILAPNQVAAVRKNPFTDEWQVLGVGMTEAYTLHTPEQAFGFGEQIIEQGSPLAALGSIADGRKAFAAFRLDGITVGGQDQVNTYLNVLTSFDASMSTHVRVSAIRVVCSNTFHAVLGQSEMPTYKVRHTGDPLETRVDDARGALDIGWQALEQFQAEAEAMVRREVTATEFDKIVAALVPMTDQMTDRQRDIRAGQREGVRAVYESATTKDIAGTAWGAWNAWTEYADKYAGNFKTAMARQVAEVMPGSITDQRRDQGARTIQRVLSLTV